MNLNDLASDDILENETIPVQLLTHLMGSKYLKHLEHIAPSYEELRDMFSEGQMASKIWLAKALKTTLDAYPYLGKVKRVLIVGAWYGTLRHILHQQCFGNNVMIDMLDIDPRCQALYNQCLDHLIYQGSNAPGGVYFESDMYDADEIGYGLYDVIINTSCEHISDLKGWLSLIPDGKIVVLQSNNFYSHEQHVACVPNTSMFKDKAGLSNVAFEGTLHCYAYDRYMLIGTK